MIHSVLTEIAQTIAILQEKHNTGTITDFKKQRQIGARMTLTGLINRLLQETRADPTSYALAQELSRVEPENMPPLLNKLASIAAEQIPRKTLKIPHLPSDIRDTIHADISEINACMNAGCYRSAIILCARVMETALHRKYYDATGQDLLEKAPGTGLGNLIAKLSEKGVKLDPGLSNQIHLINQVRVYSVHTKQEAFIPSKNQAEAIVLYTLDILGEIVLGDRMDKEFMQLAIQEAQKSTEDIGCGAVIVKNRSIISQAHNCQRATHNASAHAEILAIQFAGQKLGNKKLEDCTIYCTCEPCIMCLSALSYAKINKIVYGLSLRDIYSSERIIDVDLPTFLKKSPHKFEIVAGFMKEQCSEKLIHRH